MTKIRIKLKIYIFGSISNLSLSFSIEKLQNASPPVHPHQHLHRKAEPHRLLRKLYVDIPGMSLHNTMETLWCKQGLIGGLQTTNKSTV